MAGRHREPERGRTWCEFPELPPRPDPETGEPFPPHAPGFRNDKGVAPEHDRSRSTKLSHKPPPLEGAGPALAWHRHSRRSNIRGFFVALGLMFGGAFVMFLFEGDLGGLGYWQIWIIILVFAYLASGPLDYQTTSAGADWIKWDYNKRWYQRRARSNHLKIYELTRIEGYFAGGMLHIRFEDHEGRGADRQVGDLQRDRRIWDLFYNGLLHSVANGAEINRTAVELLKLDETPALRLREQRPQPEDG
ncbi:hypothetical protein [Amycolatopsis aidingensis]|uniref:hypothetical protein n=1 Tax=Amycolatopsis aidingensis TaxID=2842453 RepID=UPI001C0D5C90|nr:hypothetical protein [Amycolatopsis aidingensis]